MKYGYMGLSQPFETIWADGRRVLVDPNGSVIDLSTNQVVREQDRNFTSYAPQSQSSLNDKQLILLGFAFLITIVALVSIVALSNGRK